MLFKECSTNKEIKMLQNIDHLKNQKELILYSYSEIANICFLYFQLWTRSKSTRLSFRFHVWCFNVCLPNRRYTVIVESKEYLNLNLHLKFLGGWNDDGKGENIWDHLVHSRPDLLTNIDTGDIACDSYHKYKDDVEMIKNMNLSFYRFSISWSRLLPTGKSLV